MTKLGLELFIPIVLSNIIHMFVVKNDWFPNLKIPLAPKLFGKNKTYRGFIFVGIVTAILQFLISSMLYGHIVKDALSLGFLLGITYMLFELPNSFFKRQMGVAAGGVATKYAWFFTLLDKSDSTFGVCLVFVLFKGLPPNYFVGFFVGAVMLHFLTSKILYETKVKESL